MGTLRSYQWIEVDGQQVPACKGMSVNGVLLGEPLEIDGDPASAEWDDSVFPNGTVEVVDGELVVTPDEEPLL